MSYSGPGLILSACKIDGHGSNELALRDLGTILRWNLPLYKTL